MTWNPRMRRRGYTPMILLVTSALTACQGSRAESSRPTALRVERADSAGVEIVTTATPAAQVPVFATMDSIPSLSLGSMDGPAVEQFGDVRDLAPLSDGGVAVMDAQAAEVRVFGADGSWIRTVGTRGEGPGEFTAPAAVASVGDDSLAVFDARLGRVTVFGPTGTLSRVVTVAFDGYGRPRRASFFSDLRMVGQSTWLTGSVSIDGRAAFHQDSAVLVVNAVDGSLLDTVAVQAASEDVVTITRSNQSISITKVAVRFARTGVFAAHPDGVWAGFGDRWELRLHDAADGHVERILRAPGLDRPLSDAEVDAVIDEGTAGDTTPALVQAGRQLNDLSPRPELRPAYDRLLADDAGRLWLRQWPGAAKDTLRWWVFGADGGLLGSVDVPGSFQLLAVAKGQAWGVTRDDLDVPRVERRALNRPR